ncbi:early estrogen-induced gene 1 protein-like isoform X2 [Bolinopsis microptera]|uniref:early estrogen-induced gene 1 protein-like isoform X2 n=1 Tax=Bolinopsis microptera TaxID=2820187 RepID=UPI00307916CD
MTLKNQFDTTITIEHIQDVPSNSGYLFAKLKLSNGKFRGQTATKKIVNHKVDWHETFELQCSIRSDNGRLTDKNLTISVRKEVNGGKDSEKLGYFDINLAERASYNTPCQGRYILKVNKKSKGLAGNSIVVVTTSMVRVMGDPIFKTAADNQIKSLAQDNIVDINLAEGAGASSDGDESEIASIGSSSRGLTKSPAHSLDCVPTADSPPDTNDPNFTTQSLDRRHRGKQPSSVLIKNLRAKSASGSISSVSLQESFKPNLAGASEQGLAVRKHQPQSRQDSGLGGSNEEHIAT